MKPFRAIYILCVFILLAACSQRRYTIEGTAEGLSDGDTLVLTNDLSGNSFLQKTVVKDSKFKFEGDVDSVKLSLVYVGNRPDMGITFFLEPGSISINLSQDAEKCHVGGTDSNAAWQELNQMSAQYSAKMQQLTGVLYDENVPAEEMQATMKQLQQLQEEMSAKIVESAEKNIKNEMGYFIVTSFEDEDFMTPAKRMELIKLMPSEFQERKEIKELTASLKKAQSTEKGQQIEDFKLSDPEGRQVSAKEVISQHKITILDFWASWCGPCRQEMPNMTSLYQAYADKGLGILGISLDENHDAWVNAIKELGMSWPQVSDLKGWNSAAAQQFNVRAIPHVIIVDQNGVILEKGLRGKELEDYISSRLQ